MLRREVVDAVFERVATDARSQAPRKLYERCRLVLAASPLGPGPVSRAVLALGVRLWLSVSSLHGVLLGLGPLRLTHVPPGVSISRALPLRCASRLPVVSILPSPCSAKLVLEGRREHMVAEVLRHFLLVRLCCSRCWSCVAFVQVKTLETAECPT